MSTGQILYAPRRGGRTTKQIAEAPQNCIYVWPNPDIGYPKMLARGLNRMDIKFVSPVFMQGNYLCGLIPNVEVILDHATRLTRPQWEAYNLWQKRKASQS